MDEIRLMEVHQRHTNGVSSPRGFGDGGWFCTVTSQI